MRPKTETKTRFTDHFPSFQPNTHKLDNLRHTMYHQHWVYPLEKSQ